ncbi:MAG: GGDEF domain-containing protein [Bacillota bacterium]
MKLLKRAKNLYKYQLIFVLTAFILLSSALPARGQEISFTPAEKDYLASGTALKAVSIEGGAPLHYRDSKGEIKGIAVSALKEIANVTGMTVEYYLYDSISAALESDFDIAIGLTQEYSSPGISLSVPYLYSETVLFYHKSLNPTGLEGRRYAAIKGGTLPEGIREEQTIYFNDREETINAVESGIADYGYGNAYSMAFYTLQNNYKNIITIPTGKEDRAYCMGIREENKVLLSIINKALGGIDMSRMDTLILEVASQVEKRITPSMIIGSYGAEIFVSGFLIMLVMAYLVISSTYANNRYKMENKKYLLLSQLSNEYLFEYRLKTDVLELAEKLSEEIEPFSNKEDLIGIIKDSLKEQRDDNQKDGSYIIKLPLSHGDVRTFRVLLSYLRSENGRVCSIVGKLVDISEEEKEREVLIAKSQRDGLTGLYNATTAREMMVKHINDKDKDTLDVLIILDCDNFKDINDRQGHLVGDEVLKNIGYQLQLNFRQSDVIGRLGGDEFCVYMQNIPSVDFVQSKCQQLLQKIKKMHDAFPVDISIGIATLEEPLNYESLLKRADEALYVAKRRGGAQVVINYLD